MRTLKNSFVLLVSASVLGPFFVSAYATTILASAFVGP